MKMTPSELKTKYLESRRAIKDLFGDEWLQTTGDNALQLLWKRNDWIALTEILIFGDCLEKCRRINEDRTRYFVEEKIKGSSNYNERKGAVYEIITAGAYCNAGCSEVKFPNDPDNAGYDLTLTQNEYNIIISVKNYGLFDRCEEFAKKSSSINELMRRHLEIGCNSIFIINDKTFPSLMDWRQLRECLPALVNTNAKQDINGCWTVFSKYVSTSELDKYKYTGIHEPISTNKSSYVLSVYSKIHQSDLDPTFSEKFNKACKNLEKYGGHDERSLNIVFLRVPRELGLESCKNLGANYFENKDDSEIAGFFFYQPEVTGDSLSHCFELVINPRKQETIRSNGINLCPKFNTGPWNKGSAPIKLVTGIKDIISNDTEYYNKQFGRIYFNQQDGEYRPRWYNGVLMEPDVPLSKIHRKYSMRRQLLPESDKLLLI